MEWPSIKCLKNSKIWTNYKNSSQTLQVTRCQWRTSNFRKEIIRKARKTSQMVIWSEWKSC